MYVEPQPKICVKCRGDKNITRDHKVPRWLVERAHFFGLEKPDPYKNYQKMCQPCNCDKGGMIDYSDPFVREYMKKLVDSVNSSLAQHVSLEEAWSPLSPELSTH